MIGDYSPKAYLSDNLLGTKFGECLTIVKWLTVIKYKIKPKNL